MEKACASFHCKHNRLDECELNEPGRMCNGADGDEPGQYCRHMSEKLVNANRCALCALGEVCDRNGQELRRLV